MTPLESIPIIRKTMKILITSTSYPEHVQDWAGSFIKNLLFSLAKNNGLTLELWSPYGEKPQEVTYVPLPEESAWLKALMSSGGIAHVVRTKRVKSIGTIVRLLYYLRRAYVRSSDADIFHVNWLQNALPLWGIRKPAIVSVLGNDFGLLKIPGMSLFLRGVLSQRKCILAPNASWMVPELKRRFGDIAQITYIPFGVDSQWFSLERTFRQSIPHKWLVISRVTKDKIGPLFAWGEGVFKDADELHLFGPMQEDVSLPDWVHYHGPVTPAELMGDWFVHAAGLITLSRHNEGRPQVIIEAMASGLPVIASDLPAHQDVISQRQTGWLVSTADDFRAGIAWLADAKNNETIGKSAREWALKDIGTWDDCAERYIAAYRSLLAS